MEIIDKIVVKYLVSTGESSKVFFASVLTLMKKEENPNIPTMGVTIIDGTLYLYYNKNFIENIVNKYGITAIKGILEQEILHIIYEHIHRAKKFNRIPLIYNYATDMAINQQINKDILPKKLPIEIDGKIKWVGQLLFPKQFNLPNNKDAEWYYNELEKQMKHQKKLKGVCNSCGGTGKCSNCKNSNNKTCPDCQNSKKCPDCEGSGKSNNQTLDDHTLWDKIKENEQMTKEVIKKVIKEAYENTKKMRGNIPSSLEEIIKELLKPPTINWKRLLHQYIGSSIKTGFKSSWKRPNRRMSFREDVKGKTSNRTVRILVAIDTSGSMNSSEFQEFINEMKGILNVYKSKIDVIQCDAKIQGKKQTLTPYRNLKFTFRGRGGTSFTPVFDWWKIHLEYDLLIYVTDGYGDQERCNSNKPVIWVLTSNGYTKEEFKPGCGKIVKIKNQNT